MNNHVFNVKTVGTVRAGKDGFTIRLEEPYRKALNGLEGFSHIQVLWWGHLMDGEEYRSFVEGDKPYKKGPDKLGVFATRSPVRPNPIELTTAGVLSVDQKQGIIHLAWIDAEDGSPVLDIKPYHPSDDRVKNVSVPAWCDHWPKWQEDTADFAWEEEFNF
ncbi:MAG: SAM-dependent methyltransferase [Spirochaetales bacterium]|nr:SAM-dependent methyltransferase [Spirochaetales bacterium]